MHNLMCRIKRICSRCQNPCHCVYLTAAALEGHSFYAIAAIVLLVVSIPEIFEA